MIRAVPDLFYTFIRTAEAEKLTAYQDTKGVWTIGIGHTGREVFGGVRITPAQSQYFLMLDAGVASGRLAAVVSSAAIAALTDHEYAALLSFVFNLGAKPDWTIWKLLNAGKLSAIPAQLMRFDKEVLPDGTVKVVPGLINRRTAECALWAQADAVAAGNIAGNSAIQIPPSSETRDADTPPTPEPTAKPLTQSKTIWAGAATTALGALETAKEVATNVQETAQPQADNSPLIKSIAEDAGVAIVAIGIIIMLLRMRDEKKKTL